MINDGESRYCYKCGAPLNVAVAMEDELNKKVAVDEAFEILEKIMSDPELMKKFEEFKNL